MHLFSSQRPVPVIYQQIEGAVVFIGSLLWYLSFGQSVWWFVLFLFSVDASMLGYLVNTRVGAHLYNVGHSAVIPIILVIVGLHGAHTELVIVATIWLAHIGWDRAFGYGLKYTDSFKHTHLGNL